MSRIHPPNAPVNHDAGDEFTPEQFGTDPLRIQILSGSKTDPDRDPIQREAPEYLGTDPIISRASRVHLEALPLPEKPIGRSSEDNHLYSRAPEAHPETAKPSSKPRWNRQSHLSDNANRFMGVMAYRVMDTGPRAGSTRNNSSLAVQLELINALTKPGERRWSERTLVRVRSELRHANELLPDEQPFVTFTSANKRRSRRDKATRGEWMNLYLPNRDIGLDLAETSRPKWRKRSSQMAETVHQMAETGPHTHRSCRSSRTEGEREKPSSNVAEVKSEAPKEPPLPSLSNLNRSEKKKATPSPDTEDVETAKLLIHGYNALRDKTGRGGREKFTTEIVAAVRNFKGPVADMKLSVLGLFDQPDGFALRNGRGIEYALKHDDYRRLGQQASPSRDYFEPEPETPPIAPAESPADLEPQHVHHFADKRRLCQCHTKSPNSGSPCTTWTSKDGAPSRYRCLLALAVSRAGR